MSSFRTDGLSRTAIYHCRRLNDLWKRYRRPRSAATGERIAGDDVRTRAPRHTRGAALSP